MLFRSKSNERPSTWCNATTNWTRTSSPWKFRPNLTHRIFVTLFIVITVCIFHVEGKFLKLVGILGEVYHLCQIRARPILVEVITRRNNLWNIYFIMIIFMTSESRSYSIRMTLFSTTSYYYLDSRQSTINHMNNILMYLVPSLP